MEMLNVNINGNKKLQNTETIRYMIWNLPAVKTCPFRTEMCEKSCYARKAERVYPQVLPAREQNYEDSLSVNFVHNMIHTIEKRLNSKAFSGKKCVFRIHESGDFYSMEYTRKWLDICKHFEGDERIVFLAYTKSISYFVNLGYGRTCLPRDPKTSFPSNIVIRSSIWKDTAPDKIALTNVYEFPIYTALTQDEIDAERENGKKFAICKCENCSTCGMCWKKDIKDITCKIH
jgi:hypothetical protein